MSRHGNGLALALGADVLKLHGITAKTELEVRTTGESIVITPKDDSHEVVFERAFKRVMRKYHSTFLALAEE
jgi:antitoxin component of MazEF toxin-antitoxin module